MIKIKTTFIWLLKTSIKIKSFYSNCKYDEKIKFVKSRRITGAREKNGGSQVSQSDVSAL